MTETELAEYAPEGGGVRGSPSCTVCNDTKRVYTGGDEESVKACPVCAPAPACFTAISHRPGQVTDSYGECFECKSPLFKPSPSRGPVCLACNPSMLLRPSPPVAQQAGEVVKDWNRAKPGARPDALWSPRECLLAGDKLCAEVERLSGEVGRLRLREQELLGHQDAARIIQGADEQDKQDLLYRAETAEAQAEGMRKVVEAVRKPRNIGGGILCCAVCDAHWQFHLPEAHKPNCALAAIPTDVKG